MRGCRFAHQYRHPNNYIKNTMLLPVPNPITRCAAILAETLSWSRIAEFRFFTIQEHITSKEFPTTFNVCALASGILHVVKPHEFRSTLDNRNIFMIRQEV